jgi:hypothetical protein
MYDLYVGISLGVKAQFLRIPYQQVKIISGPVGKFIEQIMTNAAADPGDKNLLFQNLMSLGRGMVPEALMGMPRVTPMTPAFMFPSIR